MATWPEPSPPPDQADVETELQARVRRQAAIAELGRQALGGADLTALMNDAVEIVAQTLSVEYSGVLELLADGSALRARATVGWRDARGGSPDVGVGEASPAGYALQVDEPLIVDDLPQEARFRASAVLHQHRAVSGVDVLIRGNGRPFGVLEAYSARRRAFTVDDVHFLRAIANLLGLVSERQRADEERDRLLKRERQARADAERAGERTARLQAVTAALSEAATPEQVAWTVVSQGVAALGALGGAAFLLDAERAELVLAGAVAYPDDLIREWARLPLAGSALTAWVVRNQTPAFHGTWNLGQPPSPHALVVRERLGVSALAVLPLIAHGRPLGALALNFVGPRQFGVDERAFMLTLAAQCAQALARAEAYAAEQRARAEAEAARAEAEDIQQRMVLLAQAERQARAAAEAAIRARDEFLSIASHELRTPLTGMKGSVEVLLRAQARGLLDQERLVRSLRTINQGADRLASLIQDLLDVSRIRLGRLPFEPRLLDLAELTAETAAQFQQRDDSHPLVLVGLERSFPVLADAARIEQVLTNLLDNAAKYSPPDAGIRLALGRDGEGVRLAVQDAGIGLPPDSAELIF